MRYFDFTDSERPCFLAMFENAKYMRGGVGTGYEFFKPDNYSDKLTCKRTAYIDLQYCIESSAGNRCVEITRKVFFQKVSNLLVGVHYVDADEA